MKNHIIRVAAAVPRLKFGDVSYNTEQIIAMVRNLKDCGDDGVSGTFDRTGHHCRGELL